MNNEIDEVTLKRLRKEREQSLIHQQNAPVYFLAAWKKAVIFAGERLFTHHRDYSAPTSIDEATDKWQLIPNYEVIETYLKTASTGEALFVAVLYSFYNGDDGCAMYQDLGYHGLGDIAYRLEYEQLQIVTELMRYHTGW